jgi:drug/metabolite transporter (DMT)-like permease
MIFIPIKWVPYVFIVLGVAGVIIVAMSKSPGSDTADKVFGVVACALLGIGGIVWAIINIKKSKRDKKQ